MTAFTVGQPVRVTAVSPTCPHCEDWDGRHGVIAAIDHGRPSPYLVDDGRGGTTWVDEDALAAVEEVAR